MSLKLFDLPYDVLSHIATFLTDTDNQRLAVSCREANGVALRTGYLRKIEFDLGDDPVRFYRACFQHSRTLRVIRISGLDDPLIWCPLLTRSVLIKNNRQWLANDSGYPDGEYAVNAN